MARVHGRRKGLRGNRGRIAFVLLGVAAVGGIVFGGGAEAERVAALTHPTLETLLEEREAFRPDAAVTPESADDLRARFEELRNRRVDIEGALPPTLRTPRSRRPELRRLDNELAKEIHAQVDSVDLGRGDPDRVKIEALR